VPIIKGQNIVDLRLPAWIDGLHYEFEDLKEELKQIFHELDRANENTVLISLKPTPEWTFDQLMNCTAEFAVEWLLTSTKTKPTKVMLCPDKDGFAVADKFVDTCVADFISGIERVHHLRYLCSFVWFNKTLLYFIYPYILFVVQLINYVLINRTFYISKL
jgi:hypothetical protein